MKQKPSISEDLYSIKQQNTGMEVYSLRTVNTNKSSDRQKIWCDSTESFIVFWFQEKQTVEKRGGVAAVQLEGQKLLFFLHTSVWLKQNKNVEESESKNTSEMFRSFTGVSGEQRDVSTVALKFKTAKHSMQTHFKDQRKWKGKTNNYISEINKKK